MTAQRFPGVSKALLDRLKELFPDRLPTSKETVPSHEELARLIGQQDVMRKLQHEYDRQQNGVTA